MARQCRRDHRAGADWTGAGRMSGHDLAVSSAPPPAASPWRPCSIACLAAVAPATAQDARRCRTRGATRDDPSSARSAPIVPGSVNRTSVNLRATYSVVLAPALRHPVVRGQLDRDDHEHLGRPDRPGRAQHDRGPPRRHASCARSRSTANPVARQVNDQTIIVPLGGILPAGATAKVRVQYRATLRSTPDRLELAVHEGQRHRRRLPLDPVGQPRHAVRPARTTATRS